MAAPALQQPDAHPVTRDVSIARLHGEACWHCGAVNTALRAAGQVSTVIAGAVRVWPVVACTEHQGRELT